MQLLVLTDRPDGGKELVGALEYLDHDLQAGPLEPHAIPPLSGCDLVLVDATTDLRAAAACTRQLAVAELRKPIVVVIAEAGLAALKAGWGFDDFLFPTASPGEVETRLRVAVDRDASGGQGRAASVGDLVIDEESYQVRLRGEPLDLTYKEFELLKALAAHPNRVFTRELLLQEVWGYDYFGGSRTVDVHIRRLRAKLGPEYESLIGTVRGVGYKLVPPGERHRRHHDDEDDGGDGGVR